MGLRSSTPAQEVIMEEFIREADPVKQKEFEDLINFDDLRGFEFPFENMVMEGGGNKGIAYCGALKIFEKLGLMDKITRISGTSAGALTAALLSVGYNSDEVMNVLLQDLKTIFLDSGYLSAAYNLWKYYGAYKSDNYIETMKKLLEKKTGNPDITFREVYEKYHKELCIIATDITSMSTLFCHIKTTPDKPIWEAARMSMSIPGLMTPFIDKYSGNYYVDGGLVRNYPLQVFDGWYLSMKPEDAFVMKLSDKDLTKTIREWQFGTGGNFAKNAMLSDDASVEEKIARGLAVNKTVGLLLFSGYESEFKKINLVDTSGYREIKRPKNTKLSKQEGPKLERHLRREENALEVCLVAKHFLDLLKEIKLKKGQYCDEVTREEMEEIFSNEKFTQKEIAELLFSRGETADDAMRIISGKDNANVITGVEFFNFYLKRGINLQAAGEGSSTGRSRIKNFSDYCNAILATIDLNEKLEQLRVGDIYRTIAIYTDYLTTTDFDMEDDDKKFLIKQGMLSAVKFLKKYKEIIETKTV